MRRQNTIWRDSAFHADNWLMVADGENLPEIGDVVVSAARFGAECARLLQRPFGGLGVHFGPSDDLEAVAACVDQIDLIILDFPSFADGRAYSKARLLRDKYGYKGELRAAGDVLIDQVAFMRRCGFDSFDIAHEATRLALASGSHSVIDRFYQPLGGSEAPIAGRSWLRRAAD